MSKAMERFAFKNAREISGLSQERLAALLGVSKPTIIKRERHPERMTAKEMREWYTAMNDEGKNILDEYADSFFAID